MNQEKQRCSKKITPEQDRKRHLKHRFGITIEEYNFLLQLQKGVCALCDQFPKKIRLAVDHDHSTGFIRGLLCHRCNRFLGILEKDIFLAKRLDNYRNKLPPLGKLTRIISRKSNWLKK